MTYKIGDTVKMLVRVTEKWSKLLTCKITNKYTRNDTTYYSVKGVNDSYMCSNIKENRFVCIDRE